MNIVEHQLKSKLAGPVCTEHETKTKKTQEQWLQLKWSFLSFDNMKIVIYWGINYWWWSGGADGQVFGWIFSLRTHLKVTSTCVFNKIFYLTKKCFVLMFRFLCFCEINKFQNLWHHHRYCYVMEVIIMLISFES